MMEGIDIRVPARVHVGLIGVSEGGYRINGGLGFCLAKPELVVQAQGAEVPSIIDNRLEPLGEDEQAAIKALLDVERAKFSFDVSVRLVISGDLHPHRGVGGGTALRLAALEAMHLINRRQPLPGELIAASRRGGTSGVGVRTYFTGGFVLDMGHKTRERPRPSRDWANVLTSLPVMQAPLPDWRFGICSAAHLPVVSHEQERRLFQEASGMSPSVVMSTLYHLMYGAVAALIEDDRATFASAVDAVQKIGWKDAEWRIHGAGLVALAETLRSAGAAGIGLSSLGPSLYFLADEFDAAKVPPAVRAATTICGPDNSGRQIGSIKNA